MPISSVCPACRAGYVLADNLFGQSVRCNRCQGTFVVGAVPKQRAARTDARHQFRQAPVAIAGSGTVNPRVASVQRESKSSGISAIVIGGSIVAAVFALVLVGGIALLFTMRPLKAVHSQAAAASARTLADDSAPQPVAAPAPKDAPPLEPVKPVKDASPNDPVILATADGSLAPQVLQRVKKATVYIRVTMADNSVAQGSGFFAVEQGIVLTNAHVLGMLVGQTRKPKTIEVVLNSGQGDERSLAAKILEVDRTSDLAVLRVTGTELPEPLAVHPAKDLQETQQVYVCGFPFGTNLGKEISVRKSSVASLRKENGALVKVQLEGGMDPGNSGGPVIDARGNVVGVAVAGIRQTTINFAIPGENVHAILNGRISKVSFGQPFRDADVTKLPVTMHMVDPLGRLHQVGIDWWTGETNQQVRPPSTTQPPTQAKDSPHQRTLLKTIEGVASGELILPALPDGRAHWFQPVAITAARRAQWLAGAVFEMTAPPLERRQATLATSHKVGSLPLELACKANIRMDRAGEEHSLLINIDAQLAENTRAVDANGIATVRLEYLKMNMGINVDGKPSASTARMQQVMPFLPQLVGDLRLDRQGNVLVNRSDPSKAPAAARETLTNIGEQVQQSLESLIVPVVGSTVKPGQSWNAQRSLPLDMGSKNDSGIMDMKYTFLGVRARAGRDEAVLTLAGIVHPRTGAKQYINGKANGTAVVDVATGMVVLATATVDVDMDLTLNGQSARADGLLEVKVQRALTNGGR